MLDTPRTGSLSGRPERWNSIKSILEKRLGDRCNAAKVAWEDAHEWVQRFTTLVFVTATATVIVLVVGLGYAVAGKKAGAIAGGAGTVVTGTAAGFVLKERRNAERRQDAMRRVMDRICS